MVENKILKSFITCFIILLFIIMSSFTIISSANTIEKNITTDYKIENNEDVCTREIIKCDKNNPCYVNEEDMEQDAIIEQEHISYDGEDTSNGKSLIGENTNTSEKTVEEKLNYERYVATKSSNLNVRANSSINSKVISKIKKGDKVNVIEVKGEWSKINTPVNGWVSSVYLSSVLVENPKNYSGNTSKYSTGKYITTSNLHVRNGAGTNYKIKSYKQLTINARSQNKRLGNYYYAGYKKGVICSVTKVKGNWGLTKSGWICLDYCKKIY